MDDPEELEGRRELIEFGAPKDRPPSRWQAPPAVARWTRSASAAGRKVESSRWLVIVSVALTVTALNIAIVGWSTRHQAAAEPEGSRQGGTHHLTEDQAACFAFARGEERFSTLLVASGEDFVGPRSPTLAQELEQIDKLGVDYPGADYRLLVAFHDVGDGSIRLAAAINTIHGRDLLSQRSDLVSAAYDACAEIAHFDAQTATPLD